MFSYISYFNRQFIPSKPVRWGIKLFVLCDGCGYTYDFEVYVGASDVGDDPPRRDAKSYAHLLVMRLMDGLLDQGYTLYVDNWYTSGPLFKELFSRRTMAVGTVRVNRRGYPRELKDDMKEWSACVERGSWHFQYVLPLLQLVHFRVFSVLQRRTTCYLPVEGQKGRLTYVNETQR